MLEKIKISVIIPMYNCEGKVSGIISDLKKQTYSNFEAVLIDDGSTDSTYRVSVESCKDDKRFKIFRTKNNGPGSARNFGISKISGEYFRFIDADDRINEESLELLIRPILNDISIDLVIGKVKYSRNAWQSNQVGKLDFDSFIKDFSNDFFGEYYGFSTNKVYRKKIIDKYNLKMSEDLRWCEDYLFNLEYYSYIKNVYYVPKEMYHYVIAEGSLASQVDIEYRNKIEKICIKHLKLFLQNKNQFEKEEIKVAYSDSVAYLYHSQLCNLVGYKASFSKIKADCMNEDNQEFWKKYHNINRIRFYSTIKFLFSKRLFRLLYSFIVIKEKAKGG